MTTKTTTQPTANPLSKSEPQPRAALAEKLKRIDANAEQVKSNIRGLYRRECIRILHDASLPLKKSNIDNMNEDEVNDEMDFEYQNGKKSNDVEVDVNDDDDKAKDEDHLAQLSADRAAMIANMEAPATNTSTELPPPDWSKARPPKSPSEEAARRLMMAVSSSLVDLKGFDAHVARMKAPLEKEMRQIEADKLAQ
ncbi:hypothetical protein CP533_6384 [Ophiocordyceps camponoti-saundersi (nom. inval.)]|nr:hypothetical protein CP533_6384 [Ophiocordyceps camponoti-saundersi (nom. inval.)]